ncbi:MAG: fatty acid desaturase [Planctomycetaceae bacterium]
MAIASGETGDGLDMGTASLPGRVLDIAVLRSLSHRSDAQGWLRVAIHLGLLATTGTLVWLAFERWATLLPAMVLHGFVIVTLFAPMHECVHRTAFATPRWNELCGWFAGLLSFYNFHFYRHYHTWHHRYTQDPDRDPELSDYRPTSGWGYLSEVLGLHFWPLRPWRFLKLALGRTQAFPFVPPSARSQIARSAALQLAVYVVAVTTIAWGFPQAWFGWFLPALLAQPCLRMITLAEHTGCTLGRDGLTNTRTTLTTFPIRLCMWNMPFHTEHHLYPSIPFHQLPRAHRELRARLGHVVPGYIAAQREVLASFATGNAFAPAHQSASSSTTASASGAASWAAPGSVDGASP